MLGITGVLAVRKEDNPGGVRAAPPLEVEVVTPAFAESYDVMREFVGEVEPARQTAVAFDLAGSVAAIHFDEGARVSIGEALAELDTERLMAQQRELRARVSEAEANVSLASIRAGRVEQAFEEDAASALEWDEAREGLRAAEAARERARAALDRVDVEINKSILYAPYDAIIIARMADEGRVVAPGDPMFMLLEDKAPEARIAMPSAAANALASGTEVHCWVEGQRYPAIVRAVLPARERRTRTVDVLLQLDARIGEINTGDAAVIKRPIPVASRGTWLPMSALTEDVRGLWACFVIKQDNSGNAVVSRRPIELLHQDGERVFVRGALDPKDRIVASGTHRLVEGLRVSPATDTEQAS